MKEPQRVRMNQEEELTAITERLASCDCWVCEEDREDA